MKQSLQPAAGPAGNLADALAAGTTELWLMRVPTHSVLRKSLLDKTIAVGDASAPNLVRGNYRFSDAGPSLDALAILPVPVCAGPDDVHRYVLNRRVRFARQINVEFTGSAMAPVAPAHAARTYPPPPEDNRMLGRYRPIGVSGPLGVEKEEVEMTDGAKSPRAPKNGESPAKSKKKKTRKSGDGVSKKRKKSSGSKT